MQCITVLVTVILNCNSLTSTNPYKCIQVSFMIFPFT